MVPLSLPAVQSSWSFSSSTLATAISRLWNRELEIKLRTPYCQWLMSWEGFGERESPKFCHRESHSLRRTYSFAYSTNIYQVECSDTQRSADASLWNAAIKVKGCHFSCSPDTNVVENRLKCESLKHILAPSYKAIIKDMFLFIFNIIIETKNLQRSRGPRKIYLKNLKDFILQFRNASIEGK